MPLPHLWNQYWYQGCWYEELTSWRVDVVDPWPMLKISRKSLGGNPLTFHQYRVHRIASEAFKQWRQGCFMRGPEEALWDWRSLWSLDDLLEEVIQSCLGSCTCIYLSARPGYRLFTVSLRSGLWPLDQKPSISGQAQTTNGDIHNQTTTSMI